MSVMRQKREVHSALIVEISLWLFCTGAVLGYFLLDRKTFPAFRDYMIAIGPVATATLLYLGLSMALPDLHAPGRLGFPLNFTLPVVFVVLIRVAVILWASPSGSAFRAPDVLLPALVWTNYTALGVLLLIQIAILSVLSFLAKRVHRDTPQT